jgi:hypothetical protein
MPAGNRRQASYHGRPTKVNRISHWMHLAQAFTEVPQEGYDLPSALDRCRCLCYKTRRWECSPGEPDNSALRSRLQQTHRRNGESRGWSW